MSEGLEEIWKEYPRCRHYEVSNLGRVRSKDRMVHYKDGRTRLYKGAIRKILMNNRNRAVVHLADGGRKWSVQVSHMVMETFIRLRIGRHDVVRHLNDDPSDNRLENLRFGTYSENMHDRIRNGNDPNVNKTHCKRGHEFTPWNTRLRRDRRQRICKACKKARDGMQYPRNAGLDLQAVADSYFEKLKKENT